MNVLTGEKIIEVDTNKVLVVDIGFDGEKDIKPSKYFDFSATYENRAGVTVDGQPVYANRGFKLADEGVVWNRF